jgi:intein/homing endonuclease
MAIKGSGIEIEDFFGNLVDSLNNEFGHTDCAKDIMEFLAKEVDFESWGVTELHRRQLLLLKTFYGLELDEEDLEILDSWYQLDRSSIDPNHYVPGTKYQSLCVECGRRGSKCISLDTLIFTSYGILEAGELLFNKNEKTIRFSTTVATPKGKKAKTSHRYYNGVSSLKRITASYGYTIAGTGNHRLKVLNDNGLVEWELIENIKPGTIVCLERNADLWSNNYYVLESYADSTEEIIKEEQAYILGLIHSYFLPSTKENFSSDQQVDSRLGLLFKSLLLKETENTVPSLVWVYLIFGYYFYSTVPAVVKKSPKSVVLSFLYGYCKINSHINQDRVEVVVSCDSLAKDLQTVFINLGIITKIVWGYNSKGQRKGYLEIKEDRSIGIFVGEVIGRASQEEEEKYQYFLLRRNVLKGKSGAYEDVTIPNQQDWLLRLRADCAASLLPEYYQLVGDCFISKEESGGALSLTNTQAKLLLPWIKQNSNLIDRVDTYIEHFEELVETDYFFDEVVDVYEYEGESLDISVPGYECYTANGFTSHNTFISSVIIAYEFYRLVMMKSPQKFYGVATSTSIAIYCIATTATQTKRTMFGQAKALLEHIPKVKRLIDQKRIIIGAEEVSYPEKLIYIYSGNSSSSAQVGSSVILLAMDEVARFDEEGREAEDSNALTLWSNIGISGVTFGEDAKRLAISSAWAEGDAIQKLYQLSKTSNGWVGYRLRSWDLNPKHAARDNPIIKAEYDLDPRKAALEFEGVRFNKIYSFFDDLEVSRAFTGYSQIKVTPDENTDDQLVRLKVISIKSFTGKTYAHLDPAFVTDAYAIAFGHTEGDGEERRIIIDGLLAWQPGIGQQVSISNVYQVIYQIHNQRPLSKITSDHYNPETIQRLKLNGMNASTITFSRSKQLEIYDLFRKLLHEDRVQLPKDSPWSSLLKEELLGIQLRKNSKIDHRKDGCFVGETEILLLNGTKVPIKSLVDKKVRVFSCTEDGILVPGWAIGRKTKKTSELLKVVFADGQAVLCTPDHLFFTKEGVYIPAKDLEVGKTELMSYGGLTREMLLKPTPSSFSSCPEGNYQKIISLVEYSLPPSKQVDVYDLEVPLWHNFALGNGVFVHNSKDLADAVTAVTWNLMSSTTVNASYSVTVDRTKKSNLPKDLDSDLGFSQNARSVISQVKQNYSGWNTGDYSSGAWTIEP